MAVERPAKVCAGAGESASHAAHAVAGLIELAMQLAADSEAIRWCAYLTTDTFAEFIGSASSPSADQNCAGREHGAVWRVLHGFGEGAPKPGTVWSADEVAYLLASGNASALALPGGIGEQRLFFQPVRAGEEPGTLGALRRLVTHVHDLLERVPNASDNDSNSNVPAPSEDELNSAHTIVLAEQELRRRLVEEVARAERYGSTLSVLVLDVDETGTLADELEARTNGNVVSPSALHIIGEAVGRSLRQMDRVGRLGADRFAILLPETGAEESLTAGERLGRAVGLAVEAYAAETLASRGTASSAARGLDAALDSVVGSNRKSGVQELSFRWAGRAGSESGWSGCRGRSRAFI